MGLIKIKALAQKDSKVLILYSTVDGHTKSICEYIAEKLPDRGAITLSSIEDAEKYQINSFDEIVIGASVRYGNHRKNIYSFIDKNIKDLENKKNSFFSVNLTARKSNKNTPETNPYLQKFLKKTEWKPKQMSVFAGKLDYPSYDCVNKLAILMIMVITNGPKDISQVYELTDWSKVDDFIKLISN